MDSIVENLRIDRIIIHEIYKRTVSNVPSTLSYGTELLIMSTVAKSALQQRLIDALGNNSHSIEMDIVDRSITSISAYVRAIYDERGDAFIDKSRYIAEKLSEAQVSMQYPGGIVVIMFGTVGNRNTPFSAIIKAEVHSGFHKKTVKNTISAEYLSDLFLTPQQKLYKIGFFLLEEKETKAIVYDHNMTRSETKQAAKYFYDSFLGCKIADSSKAITQNFFLFTREFVNDLNIDNEKKMDYQDNLYSYLKNGNTSTISIADFSEKHLDMDHRDLYNEYMVTSAFPSTTIVKELDLIKNKLKKRRLNFSTGVMIQRSIGSLKEVMSILESNGDSTTVKITGKLKDQIT